MQIPRQFNLLQKLTAEFLGTAFLVAAVVGSGIMGDQLAQGNAALALLANTLSTGAILIVLILIFGPISGAHFNPLVSLSLFLQRQLPWKNFIFYTIIQILGGVAGVALAHAMFDMTLLSQGTHIRSGKGIWLGEMVASFGLLVTILGCLRSRPDAVPYAVGLLIMSAYWFTSSTSFANPAVTIARSFTDSFSGIRPDDVFCFIVAQIIGALVATELFRWLYKEMP